MTDGTGTTTRTYDAWNPGRQRRPCPTSAPRSIPTTSPTDSTPLFRRIHRRSQGQCHGKGSDRIGRLIYVLADSMTTSSHAYYADGAFQSVAYGNGSRRLHRRWSGQASSTSHQGDRRHDHRHVCIHLRCRSQSALENRFQRRTGLHLRRDEPILTARLSHPENHHRRR